MVNIFEYTDYKTYLKALIKESDVRGYTSRLAEAAGCQVSYLSNSLSGKAHLLQDHAHGLADYLKLTDDERDYFFLILDYQRANNPAYRKYVHKKITERQAVSRDLKSRLRKKSLAPSEADPSLQHYYSNYLYAALHIAVSIPALQDVKSLAKFLGLPDALILNYLKQLQGMGLVEHKGQAWLWKSGDLHLPKDSPWVQTHHANWRLKAITEIHLNRSDSLHFSGVQSLSRKDLDKLRFEMTRWIQQFRETTGPSDPEELICFNLDLFSLG